MEEQLNTLPETVEVVDIQFRPGQKVYYFDPAGLQIQPGDHVIIDTARGAEYGICAGGNHAIASKDVVAPLRSVIRLATAQDEKIAVENHAKEKRAYDICLQKIAEHNLDMQLVSAECAFDGSKILFFFTADERVDFRELVKNLASIFHTRIELRQIGVRDKAKMVGGLGICGRPFCCASFLDDFQPVSIKMAKTQNLSLNPTKISGTCGRLMCCLKYEQDAYEDLIRTSPKADSFVDTPDGRGTIVEVNLLRQQVKVKMELQPEVITTYANTDIAVLRSGKAKKNDPPIPADLAPISGSGKRARKEPEAETGRMFLDPIRFRYSTESIVEEAEEDSIDAAPVAEEEDEEVRASRSRSRRRKGPKPRQAEDEEMAVHAEPVKQEKPKAEAPKPKKPKQDKPKHEKPVQEKPKQEKPSQEKPKLERHAQEKPKADVHKHPAKKEKPHQPAAETAAQEPAKKPHRPHRPYHRRKPKSGGDTNA